MKILTLIVGLIPLYGMSQTLTPQVISASSTFIQSSEGHTFSGTLGEVVITTISQDGVILTQGFHQPSLISTPVFTHPELNYEIQVFPNPVAHELHIQVDQSIDLNYQLFDIHGRVLLTGSASTQQEVISVSSLPSGQYFLRMSDQQQLVKTFSITKQ